MSLSNVYGTLNMNSSLVVNVVDGTANSDAITKIQVDNAIPRHFIKCTNSDSGDTTNDFNVAYASRVEVQVTGNSTTNGNSFSVTGNAIQTDFTGTAMVIYNIDMTPLTNDNARIMIETILRRDRSSTLTELPIKTIAYIRNSNDSGANPIINGHVNNMINILEVTNGDKYDILAYQLITESTLPVYLRSNTSSTFEMIRLS